MQLSTNSNEAINWTVAAKATAAGRYRQAFLQMMDRKKALAATDMEMRKGKVRIEMKELEAKMLQDQIDKAKEDGALPLAIAHLEAQLQLINLEIEESSSGWDYILMQRDDCLREIAHCESLMRAACAEAEVDFASLSQEEFQSWMTEETRQNTALRLASQVIAAKANLPAGYVETLLALPPEQRADQLKRQGSLFQEFVPTLKALSGERSTPVPLRKLLCP